MSPQAKKTYTEEVLLVPQAIQVAPAERQCAKVLLNGAQQRLRRGDAQGDFWRIRAFRVMRAFHLLLVIEGCF